MFVKNVSVDLLLKVENVISAVIHVKHVIVMDHVQLVKVHSQPIQIVTTNVSHVQ